MEEIFEYKDLKNIHIGKNIQEKFEETGMSIAEFARRINCDRTTVYYTFKREDISIGQLELISKVLGHDFFRDIYL